MKRNGRGKDTRKRLEKSTVAAKGLRADLERLTAKDHIARFLDDGGSVMNIVVSGRRGRPADEETRAIIKAEINRLEMLRHYEQKELGARRPPGQREVAQRFFPGEPRPDKKWELYRLRVKDHRSRIEAFLKATEPGPA